MLNSASLPNLMLQREFGFEATYFDSKTAAAQIMNAEIGTRTLRLLNRQNQLVDEFDRDHLWCRDASSKQLVLSVGSHHDDRRLVVEQADVPPEIWAYLQATAGRHRQSLRQPLRLIFACLMFVTACIGTFTLLIPAASDRLAQFVPHSFEQTLGDRLEQVVLRVSPQNMCGSSADHEYLFALAERLQFASGTTIPVSIHVIDLAAANAFALPSGRIYVTRPLLDLSQSPDELISILAHEMGHVQAQHALRLSLRVGGTSAALGFLLGDFTGSAAVLAIGQTLIGTAFSRAFEQEADALSVPIMQKLGISPLVLADMLTRLESGDHTGGILATHPVTSQRIQFLRQADTMPDNPEPRKEYEILSNQGWKSLKLICD